MLDYIKRFAKHLRFSEKVIFLIRKPWRPNQHFLNNFRTAINRSLLVCVFTIFLAFLCPTVFKCTRNLALKLNVVLSAYCIILHVLKQLLYSEGSIPTYIKNIDQLRNFYTVKGFKLIYTLCYLLNQTHNPKKLQGETNVT